MDNYVILGQYGDRILCLDGEKWKEIEGYEGKYAVSTCGRVFSLTRVRYNIPGGKVYKGRMLSQNKMKSGYLGVALLSDGVHKLLKVHRLVAQAFIPNPFNKPQVDHIDGNPKNNNVCNLRWATAKENVNNPNTICHKKVLMFRSKNPMARAVYGENIQTGKKIYFDCMESACDFLGVKYQKYIGLTCRGKRSEYKGYVWHFA